MLTSHIWSFAGAEEDADINATFLQPFLSDTTKDSWTFSLNTESTHDWEAEEGLVPVNGSIFQLVNIGGQPVGVFGGVRYGAVSPEDLGLEGWGTRFGLTFLFPKRTMADYKKPSKGRPLS